MKPETLDALLLDRALGELSPEVSALLDAYLAQDPPAVARAAEFSTSVALARSADAIPSSTAPRLDLSCLPHAHRNPLSSARRWEFLRLAACLAVGLVAGWLARPAPNFPSPAVASAAAFSQRPSDPGTQFWSIDRFAPEARRSQFPQRP